MAHHDTSAVLLGATHDPGVVGVEISAPAVDPAGHLARLRGVVSSEPPDRDVRQAPVNPGEASSKSSAGTVAVLRRQVDPSQRNGHDGTLNVHSGPSTAQAGWGEVTSGLLMKGKRAVDGGEATVWMALTAVAAWFGLHPEKLAPLDIDTIERMAQHLDGRRQASEALG